MPSPSRPAYALPTDHWLWRAPEVEVLARTVYGEARGEKLQGQVAVAHVILNRVTLAQNHPIRFSWWGSNVRQVCLSKYQFSCWLASDPNSKLITDPDLRPDTESKIRSWGAAYMAYIGGMPDPTDLADHYHSSSIPPPSWTKTLLKTVTIGHHIFYRSEF